MRTASQAEGYILALDLDGNVKLTLQDPHGEAYPFPTSAIEHEGMLYLGSHITDGIGRFKYFFLYLYSKHLFSTI